MSPKAPQTFRKLSRRDLRSFKPEGQRMVLAAMTVPGVVGRVSARGHAIIRGPQGGTMSVSPSAQPWNRGVKNTEATFKSILGMTVEEAENMAGAKTSTEEPAASNAVADAEAPRTPLLCPAKGCGKTFATEGARYGHITADHIRCRDLNCVWVSPNGDYKGRFVAHNEQSENLHYQRSHGDLQGQVKKRPTAEPDTSTVTVRHVPPPGRRYDTTRSRAGGPEIGAAVLAARMARKMQVAAFAASAGVAENTVRRVEHGETVMVTNLLKITDSLGLNPDGTERGAQSVEDLADEVEVSFVDEPVDETALEVTTEQMEPVPDVHGVGESIGGMTTDDLVALAATITAELQRRADVATESGDWKRKFEDLEAKVSMIREVWEL